MTAFQMALVLAVWFLACRTHSARGYAPEFGKEMCAELQNSYQELRDNFEGYVFSTVRYVDPLMGVDNESCLWSSDGSAPCKTINFALEQENATTAASVHNISVTLLPGEHHLPFRLIVRNSSFIRIRGVEPYLTRITCTKFPNEDLPCSFDQVDLQSSSMLFISNITFTRCGPIPVALFMEDVTDLIIEDCVFEGNLASPILALDFDHVYLVRNTFSGNRLAHLSSNVTQFPCTRIARELFFYSDVRTAGGISVSVSSIPMNLFVWQSMFLNNSAHPNLDGDTLPERLRPLGRGGAIAVRLVNASNSHMCIKDSKFLGNIAEVAAGAISFSVASFTNHSSLTLWNVLLEDNKCEISTCVGGGLHFQTDGQEIERDVNVISIYDSVFRRNTAGIGAAFIGFTDALQGFYFFHNTTFEDNKGHHEGGVLAVLNFFDFTMLRTRLWITDCWFIGNSAVLGNRNVPPVYTYHAVVTMSGTVVFSSNIGGGVSVNQGLLKVEGHVSFSSNVALHGGGLKLIDRAQLLLSEGSALMFLNNTALQAGGAIFATKPVLSYNRRSLNRRCFIQYNSPLGVDIVPNEWKNVSVVFQGNKAARDLGNDIFGTDFLNCRYTNYSGNTSQYNFNISIFNTPPDYNSPFYYRDENGKRVTDPALINKRISTSLVRVSIDPQTLQVALGDTATFRINGFDEVGGNVSGTFVTQTNLEVPSLGSIASGGSTFMFTVKGQGFGSKLDEQCSRAQQDGRLCTDLLQVPITFEVQDTVLKENRTLNLQQCHPGYSYSNSTGTCLCHSDDSFEILRCTDKYFYVQDGIWVGFFFNDTVFIHRIVPLSHLNCARQVASGGQSSLPGCLVKFDRAEEQCAEGREGHLCATCDADRGYGITMDLTRCTRECSAGGAILFVLICVATVVGCVVVLYFNIGIPNELRGFFLFAQVIGLVYRHTTAISASELGTDFVDFIANMLGTSLPFPVCISPAITTTWMTVLGYVPPALAFITVLVFVISARYVSRLAKRSTLSGITLISLFVYKYITDVSFVLMNCTYIPETPNTMDTPSSMDLWLNRFSGQLCFQLPHVFWLVVALLLTFTVIFPIPVFILVINLKQFSRMKHFSDALSNGMGQRRGFYAAWDLFRRLYFVLIAVWLPVILLPNRLLALLLFEIVMLVVHCLSKPYEKKWINVVEALILLDLFVATAAILQSSDRYITQGLIVLLVLLPYLYAIPMTGFLLGRYVWRNALSDKWRERISVRLSPLLTWYSNLRASSVEKKAPEPKAFSNQQTSKFYVCGDTAQLSFEGSGENADDPEELQYRIKLGQD